MHQQTVVMAACKTYEERIQMQRVLNYSFDTKCRGVSTLTRCEQWKNMGVKPIDFSNGTVGNIRLFQTSNKTNQIKKKSQQLECDNKNLLLYGLLSFILYLPTLGKDFGKSTLSLGALAAQFALHKPGNAGLVIKFLLCALQLGLIYMDSTNHKTPQMRPS